MPGSPSSSPVSSVPSPPITLFLCGDVMTGRGIDQILPHPGAPALYEPCVASALEYVRLAERRSGPIPQPVDFAYVWGEALAEFARRRPDVRIINLETAITTSDTFERKGINYRMHPANIGVLTAAGIDCCVLANNHVLDWGRQGLLDTVDALDRAGIRHAGAGRDRRAAEAPAVIEVPGKGRVMVFAFAAESSGVPPRWAAGDDAPGVAFLADLAPSTAARIAAMMRATRRPRDVVVASLHWGSNWGYAIPDTHTAFARALIDGGADVVYGHSSHHPRAIEVYREKPILYGCGDFLNDYEGIEGYEAFRGDLALMYWLATDAGTGTLDRLEMSPLQMRRFRLNRPSAADVRWLRAVLDREAQKFGAAVTPAGDERLRLVWR